MILTTTALTKIYGDHHALAGVDLAVAAGSCYGLVGPNGAGKTTLLAILAGLRRPTGGTVSISVPRQRIAVLPDTPQFDPWLTGHEVAALAATLAGVPDPHDRARDALRDTGLADAADRRTGGYSRGMLQRLGIATTLVGDPDLLLLDEPASALDPAGRREVLDLIVTLRGRVTVLLSSHILTDVQQVCDTVGILRAGTLLFQGPLHELLVGHAATAYLVTLRDPAEPVLRALDACDWVTAVTETSPGQLRVAVSSTDAAERHLPEVLVACHARVISMTPEAADLERVFLELTS